MILLMEGPLELGGSEGQFAEVACGIGRSKCVSRVCGGWNGIHFVGRIGAQAPPRMLDEAQRLVNSSVVDDQPLSVLEAFAAGFPVVSTPTGGIAERVREGKTGFVVVPDAPPSAPIIERLLERLLRDPQRALLIARRARRDLDQYTWSQVREGWAVAYHGTSTCVESQAF
jgi:glycosyltransferase involved in cell wall biosynthesis